MKINNGVKFSYTVTLNHGEQTSKYENTLQICRLNVNLWLMFSVFM